MMANDNVELPGPVPLPPHHLTPLVVVESYSTPAELLA
jgi:hypothetical protein